MTCDRRGCDNDATGELKVLAVFNSDALHRSGRRIVSLCEECAAKIEDQDLQVRCDMLVEGAMIHVERTIDV